MTRRRLHRLRDAVGRRYDRLRALVPERHARLDAFVAARTAYSDARVTRGRCTYGRPLVATYPGDHARVTIGSFTSIAVDVILMDGGDHRTDWVSTFPFRAQFGLPGAYSDGHPTSRGDIHIGNDVWIGRGARIRSGITIGDGAVVGAYSIVTRNVRPYAIVAGNPAREIRRRFTDEQVEALQRIAWWEWPLERIRASVPELCGPDIDGFIARYRVS